MVSGQLIRTYLSFLKEEVGGYRYYHCLRVARISARLARIYGTAPDEAWTAGLFHDLARELPSDKLLNYVNEGKILVDPCDIENPVLLHGKVGAFLLKERFPGLNKDIFLAVENHIMGRKNMTDLEKIVYIADFIEPGRKFFKPEYHDWIEVYCLDMLFNRVERTISLYYKKR